MELNLPVFTMIDLLLYIAANLGLVVCLVLTTRRTRHQPRFSTYIDDENLLLDNGSARGRVGDLWKSTNLDAGAYKGPVLKVKLAQKIKFEGNTNLYTMHVETNDEDNKRFKVTKTYA